MLTLAATYAGVLGGAERTLLDFADGLPGGVALACPEGPVAEAARERGLMVFPLRSRALEVRGSSGRALRAAADLAGHARELRSLASALAPDLLVAWGARTALAAPGAVAGLSPRVPVLARHVDFLPAGRPGALLRAALTRVDAVSVNSHAVADDLDPGRRLEARLQVQPPGVELDAYDPAWTVSPRREALLLGALVPWKRPDLALEAVARAARELPDLHLTVAGAPLGAAGPAFLDRLRARAARPDLAGRVTFAGALADPRPALARAWCLLHAADREPWGSVILQALAAGRPVVAPRSGGPAEIVDGPSGVLFPPGDAGAAAAALVACLRDPEEARTRGTAARVRAGAFTAAAARDAFGAFALRTAGGRAPAVASPPGGALSLVTVTHNSAAVLPALLGSVERHLPGAEMVVVDSGSSDTSAEEARAAGATVLELGENAGFGRGSNAGVRAASRPVTALVNPDVELLDASLEELAHRLTSADRILVPRVVSPDGRVQDVAQVDPASPWFALRALLPPALLPRGLRRRVEPFRARTARPAGWGVGCCLVARTETLRRLGPFDERIFLFAEDLELGLRASRAGVETWFAPEARVVHADAHSTDAAFGGEPFARLARQRHAVVGELRGPAAARRDDRLLLLTYANRALLKAVAGRAPRRELRQLRAQWRARRAPASLAGPQNSPS